MGGLVLAMLFTMPSDDGSFWCIGDDHAWIQDSSANTLGAGKEKMEFWVTKTLVGPTTILAIVALCGAVAVSLMGMGAALADICAMAGSFLLLGGRYLAVKGWFTMAHIRACFGGHD